MRGSQWLIKIYILYVMEIKIIQKIIFKLTIKCKCRDSLSDVFFFFFFFYYYYYHTHSVYFCVFTYI